MPLLVVVPTMALLGLAFYPSPVWQIFEQSWNMQVARLAGCSTFWEIAQGWDQRDGRFRPVFNAIICLEAQTSPLVIEILRLVQVAFLVISAAFLLGAFKKLSSASSIIFALLVTATFSVIPGLWQSVSNTWYSEITALCFLVLGTLLRKPYFLLSAGLLATFTKESFGIWLVVISTALLLRRQWIWGGLGLISTGVVAWFIATRQGAGAYPTNQLSPLRDAFLPESISNIAGLASALATPTVGLIVVLLCFKSSLRAKMMPLAILATGVLLALLSILHGTFRYQYVLDVTDLHALPATYLILLGVLWLFPSSQKFRFRTVMLPLSAASAYIFLLGYAAWEARGAHLSARNLSQAVNGLLSWAYESDLSGETRVALPRQVPPNSISAYVALDSRFDTKDSPQWLWGDDPGWSTAEYFVRLNSGDVVPSGYSLIYPAGEVGGVYRR